METIKNISEESKYNHQYKYFHLLRQAQNQAREVGDIPGMRLLRVEVKRIREGCLFLESMGLNEEHMK